MQAMAQSVKTSHPTSNISVAELASTFAFHQPHIALLSLDCFDTLLWRTSAAPKDIFAVLAEHPLFKQFGVTAYQRRAAAMRAYRLQFAKFGYQEITLKDIYASFTALTASEQKALREVEVATEAAHLYALPQVVNLMETAIAANVPIIIVSDTYFSENDLRMFLAEQLPAHVLNGITAIYCSSAYKKNKSNDLFSLVLAQHNLQPNQVLHIGDHPIADLKQPHQLGLRAHALLHAGGDVGKLMRLQNAAANFAILNEPALSTEKPARYNPFRGLFASGAHSPPPATLIGYHSFGPVFFAFAHFLTHEIAALADKQPKVFFLLRDGHQLAAACEAYAGRPLGQRVHLRKFSAVAASFKTVDDVDFYLASIKPEHYHFQVICEQLLIPAALIPPIIHAANSSAHPQATFNALLHREDMLTLIFQQSSAYRARFKKYLVNHLHLSAGDTVMLVDMGYIGVTQKHLTRAFAAELSIHITGRYVFGSYEPDRPDARALITTTACDHTLFEQAATLEEGAVIDYDDNGAPIFESVRLQPQQYQKVRALQHETLRFIEEANHFFASTRCTLTATMLSACARAALHRHVYFPLPEEIAYFETFQHDKDMGADGKKTVFNVQNGLHYLRHHANPCALMPYEARHFHLETAVFNLVDRALSLELGDEQMSCRHEIIPVLLETHQVLQEMVSAQATHDGYFTLTINVPPQSKVALVFGQCYQWLQISNVQLLAPRLQNASAVQHALSWHALTNRGGDLFECTDLGGAMVLQSLPNVPQSQIYQLTIRPVIKR